LRARSLVPAPASPPLAPLSLHDALPISDQPRRAVTPSRGPAPGQDDPERSGRRTTRRSRMPLWLDTVVTMAVALLIAVLVKTFLIQPFYIPSASMNPTLLNDDKILVSKLTPGVFDLHRGDVVVFEDPAD